MSVSAKDKFDILFFVIVAYWEGRKIQNHQVFGHLSTFKI